MSRDEITVPKEVREFMLSEAKETILGQKNGAKKQYRYGNLHIREYDDKFLVHVDKIDPIKDPLGHLIHDAPEVIVGLTCAAIVGSKTVKSSIPLGIITSVITGYLGYMTTKKLKDYLEKKDVES